MVSVAPPQDPPLVPMPLNKEKTVDWPPVLPFNKQSVPVLGTKRPGQTGDS